MNKRLGVRSCRVLFDNHTLCLLNISCLAVSVCIWQSGGQGLWSLLSWITVMAMPIQAGTAVVLGAPPGAPQKGGMRLLKGRVGSEQTNVPSSSWEPLEDPSLAEDESINTRKGQSLDLVVEPNPWSRELPGPTWHRPRSPQHAWRSGHAKQEQHVPTAG